MKTITLTKAFMARKVYSKPLCEVMQLGSDLAMMKDLNEASLPAHMAPERKPGKLDGNAPVF